MLNIKDVTFRYLMPAGLVGIIVGLALGISNRKLSEGARLNALFDDAYNQVQGDSTTHDEYYLVGNVVEEGEYISIGVGEIIYSPNETVGLRIKKEDLPRIPETGEMLVLKVLLCTDEYGLSKKSFSYLLRNKDGL